MTEAIEFREIVRARTNIVEIIGESIALLPRRGGAEFVGLCPFHDDHNPSMCVYPDRQSYRCWVCEAGGDVFSFVMKHESVSFPEALKLLADRVGLELPQSEYRPARNGSDKPRLLEVLAWADWQFRGCLNSGSEANEARQYLHSRGISRAMVEEFGLGYHPADWQWLIQRAQGNCQTRELATVDLARQRRDGSGMIDAFVDRVIFPIRDERGRVVAFGGRVLPGRDKESGPKYLNSGDTPVFSKSKLVYGLDLAREHIRHTGVAIVMEGYTDCIAAHQAGYRNTVSTLGTALAETHVALLKRFARTVVLVFDGDTAGQQAAERALLRFLAQDVDLRILALPAGLDPADYLAKDDEREFEARIQSAPEALEFKLLAAIDRFGVDTVDGRSRVTADILDTLGTAPRLAGSVREGVLLRKVADRLSIPEQTLRDELRRRRGESRRPATPPQRQQSDVPASRPVGPDHPAERELLAIIITQPELFEDIVQQIGSDDFQTPRLREVYEYCRDIAEYHGLPAYDLLMTHTDDPDLKQRIVGLDADARRLDLAPKLHEDPHASALPTNRVIGESTPIPSIVTRVIKQLTDRRDLAAWQASCGQFVQRHGGEALDDSAREQLRKLQQQLASMHLS